MRDKIPLAPNLKHKAAIGFAGYQEVDGQYAKDHKSDTFGMSIGYPDHGDEWDDGVSIKVWRENEDGLLKRQAEELPLHRALDLAIFASQVLIDILDGKCPDGKPMTTNFYKDLKIEVIDEDNYEEVVRRLMDNDSYQARYLSLQLNRLKNILNETDVV